MVCAKREQFSFPCFNTDWAGNTDYLSGSFAHDTCCEWTLMITAEDFTKNSLSWMTLVFLPTPHKLLFHCEQRIDSHSLMSFAAPHGNGEHGASSDPEVCPSWGNVPPTARHGTKGGQIFHTRMGKNWGYLSLPPNILGSCGNQEHGSLVPWSSGEILLQRMDISQSCYLSVWYYRRWGRLWSSSQSIPEDTDLRGLFSF